MIPRITIDGREAEVNPGETLLQVARRLGLDIPALCFLQKCGPMNSCLVCVVKVTQNGRSRVVPSCGLRAEDGMVVESETDEVRELRRTALELLFSDHVGDCLSPCHRICPLDLNIPRMIRQIEAGRNDQAIAIIRSALALPATLGRLCHAPCQNGCRRSGCGGSAAIRELERFAADTDYGFDSPSLPAAHAPTAPGRIPLPENPLTVSLSPDGGEGVRLVLRSAKSEGGSTGEGKQPLSESPQSPGPNRPYLPPCNPSTGRRVAIVGAGPAGLAAAYHLLHQGHACVVFDRNPQAGGSLRTETDETALPRDVLDTEIRQIERFGAEFRLSTTLGGEITIEALQQQFDAVLLTLGELATEGAARLGLPVTPTGLQSDPATGQIARAKTFVAGSMVKPAKHLVRAMSDGQAVAGCVHQFLLGLPIRPRPKPLSSVMGRLDDQELSLFLKIVSPAPRTTPAAGLRFGFNPQEAQGEAARCLHCDCRAAGSCALQHYAELYGANPNRIPRQRRMFQQELHPADVIFESGKCILCGICVQLAKQAAEPLGLTFVGRGFDVQVSAPFNRAFAEGLKKVAAECVAACPTGAIVFRDGKG